MKPRRPSLLVVLVTAGSAAAVAVTARANAVSAPPVGQSPVELVARCEIAGDPAARIFQLERTGSGAAPQWALAYRDDSTAPRWIRLPLPGARPKVEPRQVTVDYRSPNGGIIVALVATPDSSSLDVYVSYELEVNVDVSLKPEIDHLNTNGVVRRLTCEVRT